ncbi:MAG: hypothetical protein ACKOWL_03110 [Sphingobacteriaceae bacterium]
MRTILASCILCFTFFSCGKKGAGVPAAPAPTKPSLAAPAQNEACLNGTVVSATESKILFSWIPSTNAESYDLIIKNLLTQASTTQNTTNTALEVTLLQNTPYSWQIIAKTSKTTSTTPSDIWKFFNSGSGITSHAPFPAEIVTPTQGQAVTASGGKITLDWNGSDVDNDISTYDVYLGTTNSPSVLQSNLTASVLNNVSVTAGTTYYWKVLTKDVKGNTSDSGIYSFSVN